MSATGRHQRFTRWQKAAALVPLALIAGAWTANLGSAAPTAAHGSPRSHADIPTVPGATLDDPASVTVPPSLDPGRYVVTPNHGSTSAHQTGARPDAESANGIPAVTLAAYRRAEAVLAQADPACRLPWELVAAIGRVESDHGRYGGNVVGDDGTSTPGVFGPALDGTRRLALVNDTDGGAYDHDSVYDHAVGPMQFIPSTWQIVGVDGDADGARNPQDIDDAAIAAGVYLCAGANDLSTVSGQRAAVYSYNHSDAYVDLVLNVMRAYQAGDFSSVANGLPSDAAAPALNPSHKPRHHKPHHGPRPGHHQPTTGGGHGTTGGGAPGGGSTSGGGSTGGGSSGGSGTGGGSGGSAGGGNPGSGGSPGGGGSDPTDPVTSTVPDTVDPVVEATNKCLAAFEDAGIDPTQNQLNDCVAAYQAGGMAAVDNLVQDLLDVLGGVVGGGGLLGG
jgi:membrane-bound lytic murein transglycosylase B